MDEINALKGEPGFSFPSLKRFANRFADSVKSLEDTYGWTITTATSSPPTVTMTYKSSLQLFFHPSAFRNPGQEASNRPNAPIGLTYTGTTQPLPTTLRFFLQLLRASLHALPGPHHSNSLRVLNLRPAHRRHLSLHSSQCQGLVQRIQPRLPGSGDYTARGSHLLSVLAGMGCSGMQVRGWSCKRMTE